MSCRQALREQAPEITFSHEFLTLFFIILKHGFLCTTQGSILQIRKNHERSVFYAV